MNFFKSILSDEPDPDPPIPEKPQESAPLQSHEDVDPDHSLQSAKNPNSGSGSPTDGGDGGIWSFGGLIKTLTTRSESLLETYRRDLQEFGSGLKKETELFREVASRAVKDLPNSVEVIDGVIKSTAEIISHGKETLLESSDAEPETPDTTWSLYSTRYSRFESQLTHIQNDPSTYCVEPEDIEDYKKWKSGFELKEESEKVENLISENGSLEGIYKMVVPNEVDHEIFWCRYFYRVHKLKQQESVRAKLVKRAISVDDDEELSWDVDDEEEEEEVSNAKSKGDEQVKKDTVTENAKHKENESGIQDSSIVAKEVSANVHEPIKQDSKAKQATSGDVKLETVSSDVVDRKEDNQGNAADSADKSSVTESNGNVHHSKKEESEDTSHGKKEEALVVGSEGKDNRAESVKDNDASIATSHKAGADEDDLDWADIEDVEGDDDKKPTSQVASSNKADLRKKINVVEDDEDLSWDIEDDDEPLKS